jgi:hypothetical protein
MPKMPNGVLLHEIKINYSQLGLFHPPSSEGERGSFVEGKRVFPHLILFTPGQAKKVIAF